MKRSGLIMKRILMFVILSCMTIGARGALELSSLLSNNMVLQRETTVKLWGTANAFARISATCSWDNHTYSAKTDQDGNWSMEVQTPEAGGPYTIEFSNMTGGDKITLRNVMIGEVWICSGQSNMVHPIRGYANQPVDHSEETLAEADQYKDIHSFIVPRVAADTPQEFCEGVWRDGSAQYISAVSAVAYFFAKNLYKALNIPIGIIVSSYGSSRIEAWMSPEALAEAGGVDLEALRGQQQVQKRPTVLYNSMIVPIRNYTARGFTWFQLPANRLEYKNYATLLTTMIKSWRAEWGNPDMPFINVQDCMFPWDGSADKTTLPLIIEQQYALCGKVPGYYVASSTDLGSPTEPHHPQKDVNGERMARLALKYVYGQSDIKADAPDFESVRFDKGKAVVTFSNAEDGLICRGDSILAFELSGADQKFHPAQARIIDGSNRVEVWSDEVAEPVALRYAFRNYCLVSLYDKHGLTPRPYRTDCWDSVR